MESHGLPGRIQMTRSVYDRVRPQIACQRRGMILVKGHGRVETFWVDDSLLNE
jgi:class 3 adenylate cyclase